MHLEVSQEYFNSFEYFSNLPSSKIGLTIGGKQFGRYFLMKNIYRHLSGGILEAFGKLFFKKT